MGDDPSIEEVADGMALWNEHRPQTAEDWRAVAGRFIADDADESKSAPMFAALVKAERELAACRADQTRQIVEALRELAAEQMHEGKLGTNVACKSTLDLATFIAEQFGGGSD